MKKGITVYTKYDRCGRWTLIVEKEKGNSRSTISGKRRPNGEKITTYSILTAWALRKTSSTNRRETGQCYMRRRR